MTTSEFLSDKTLCYTIQVPLYNQNTMHKVYEDWTELTVWNWTDLKVW